MANNNCLSPETLSLYCSDDLSSEEMQSATEHLADCFECNQKIAGIRAALSALPQHEVSLSEIEKNRFAARVMQSAARSNKKINFQVWGAAATTVAAGLLAVMIFQPGNMPVDPVSPGPTRLAELDLAENLDMLEDMELLENLDLLELLDNKG